MSEIEIKNGTFLKLALEECDNNIETLKKRLAEEYEKYGTHGMAKRWGYHHNTIWLGLKKLGIKLKPKGWQNHKTIMEKALEKYGGWEKLLMTRKEVKEIAQELGVSRQYLNGYMNKMGYKRIRRENRWVKKQSQS